MLIILGFVGVSVFGGASAANAHATLLLSTPHADATLNTAPATVSLVFDEPVTIGPTPVTVLGPGGPVPTAAARLEHGRTAVDVRLSPRQSPGLYTLRWQVTGQDGDVVDGQFEYAVGAAEGSVHAGVSSGTGSAWETGLLRALMFLALALSVGEYAARQLVGRVRARLAAPGPWVPWTTLIGAAAATGLALLLLGSGSVAAAFTRPQLPALASGAGPSTVIEVAGFVGSAGLEWVFRRRWSRWSWWAALPLVAVILGEAVRAHPGAADPLLGMPLSVLHLAGAMGWAGGLAYLLRTLWVWRDQPGVVRAAVSAYSTPVGWVFVVVIASGIGSALLLVPLNQVLTTPYGRTLVIKVVVVIAAAAAAWIARRSLRRVAAVRRIARAAQIEAVCLAGVLALSAVLTVLPPPVDANAALPFAPAANGPVEPLAAFAGMVSVSVHASAGQLVVHLRTPDSGHGESSDAAALSGSLTDPAGAVTALAFRRCGAGCFYSPAPWRRGTNRLMLAPRVPTWPTTTVGFSVVWPTLPVGSLLTRTIAAMKAVPELALYERVTADSRKGPGALSVIHISGSQFLQNSLLGAGKVPSAVRLPGSDGNTRLLISYPADHATDDLTIAPDGRILQERLTSSDLISNTFVYPKPTG